MALKLNSKKQGNAEPLLDYRKDPRLAEMTARLAAIEAELPGARQDRDAKRADVEALAESRFRLEQAVLAGRAPESDLTPVLAHEMELKRAAAMAAIHVDDREHEQAKLERDLPDIRRRAKQAAAHNLRQRSLDLMASLESLLRQAAEVDKELYANHQAAGEQFGLYGDKDDGIPPYGAALYPGYIARANNGLMQQRTVGRDLEDTLARIDRFRADILSAHQK